MSTSGRAPLPRILVVTDHYPPHFTGGYDLACAAICERLRLAGCDVAVLTSQVGGVVAGQAHVFRTLHRTQDSASLPQLAWWEALDHHRVRRMLATWKPHLVSVWSLLQLFPSLHHVFRACGRPVVYNLHDLWIPRHYASWADRAAAWRQPAGSPIGVMGKGPARAAANLLAPYVAGPERVSSCRIRHAVFCSRFRMDQHAAVGLTAPDARVIYNGVDLHTFDAEPRSLDRRPVRLLFVGRLVEEKGLGTLLEAWERLLAAVPGGATLTVIGIPSFPHTYADRIAHLIERGNLRASIEIKDPVPNAQLARVYAEHDVLVFPSTGPEGFPVTLLEAAACGLAIVGTATGGTGEFLVDGETGLTVPPGDAVALADALLRVVNDPGRRRALASNARHVVHQRFDIDQIARQTLDYYQTLTAGLPVAGREPGPR